MKFAHMADCHLGAWANSELTEVGLDSFTNAIDICIKEGVDFVIISGDLFDTGIPSINVLNIAAKKLKELKDNNISIYVVSGSHDYSATGKTMLNVLESAGIMIRVDRQAEGETEGLRLKFTIDEKTGVKLVGMPGRKGTLEEKYYEDIDRKNLEEEDGFKIFVFHSAIKEFRPTIFEQMKAIPLSLFPKGFDYYAGGHVHKEDVFEDKNYGKIVYPGGTFPNNYRELEKFKHGGFFIVEADDNNIKVERRDIKSCDVIALTFDAQNKTPEKVEEELREAITDLDVKNKIVLIRVEGVLTSGRVTEIGLRDITKTLKENNARITRVNINKLSTREYEEISIEQTSTKEELEDKLIREQVGQHELGKLSVDKRIELTKSLLQFLSEEKNEGERNADYTDRIFDGATNILGIKKELEALQ